MCDTEREGRAVYAQFKRVMDMMELEYGEDKDEYTLFLEIATNDFPVRLFIRIEWECGRVSIYSHLPFEVGESTREVTNMAVAVCNINQNLWMGNFDYMYSVKSVLYRLNINYRSSILSDDVIKTALFLSHAAIDKYDDKLYLLSKGKIKVEDVTK